MVEEYRFLGGAVGEAPPVSPPVFVPHQGTKGVQGVDPEEQT